MDKVIEAFTQDLFHDESVHACLEMYASSIKVDLRFYSSFKNEYGDEYTYNIRDLPENLELISRACAVSHVDSVKSVQRHLLKSYISVFRRYKKSVPVEFIRLVIGLLESEDVEFKTLLSELLLIITQKSTEKIDVASSILNDRYALTSGGVVSQLPHHTLLMTVALGRETRQLIPVLCGIVSTFCTQMQNKTYTHTPLLPLSLYCLFECANNETIGQIEKTDVIDALIAAIPYTTNCSDLLSLLFKFSTLTTLSVPLCAMKSVVSDKLAFNWMLRLACRMPGVDAFVYCYWDVFCTLFDVSLEPVLDSLVLDTLVSATRVFTNISDEKLVLACVGIVNPLLRYLCFLLSHQGMVCLFKTQLVQKCKGDSKLVLNIVNHITVFLYEFHVTRHHALDSAIVAVFIELMGGIEGDLLERVLALVVFSGVDLGELRSELRVFLKEGEFFGILKEVLEG